MKSLLRLLILMLTAGLAFAQPLKLSKDLVGKDLGARVDIIVQFTTKKFVVGADSSKVNFPL